MSKVKKMTVGGAFKLSLADLMQEMARASPHFIRCVKPNEHKAAHDFDEDLVQKQVFAGLLDPKRDGWLAPRPTRGVLTIHSCCVFFSCVIVVCWRRRVSVNKVSRSDPRLLILWIATELLASSFPPRFSQGLKPAAEC